ncbi:MAG: D-alanine--D-alanine ligase, partial [Clostridia bacterium]|nr:D-alanine--D-alanine ligase [Clostridia bacterium]
EKIDNAEKFSQRLIVEHMITDLKEINCSVLGDCDDHQSSVCEEPLKTGDFLSYEDKYMGGTKTNAGMQASDKRIPAELPEEMSERIRKMAGDTFAALSCHGVSRIDVMIDNKDNSVYVNEINTIPGSLSFYLWEATNMKYTEMLDKLIEVAYKRKRRNSKLMHTVDVNLLSCNALSGNKFSKTGKLGK